MTQWLSDPTHQALFWAALGGLVSAVLDFVFAVNPNAKSNGFLHWIYILAGKGKGTGTTPPQQ